MNPDGPYTLEFPKITYATTAGGPSPKALRKRAKAEERRRAAAKAQAKASHKVAKADRERKQAAMSALVAVAQDESKGYARVWAARSILGLEA